jgi:hypothetical protein
MKKTVWDILIDCNNFRTFRTNLSTEDALALLELLKSGDWIATKWKGLRARLARERSEKAKPSADFISIDLAFDAMSGRARAILEDLVSGQMEFLPIETPVGPYYGLHVSYVDCLDVEHAEVLRYKSSGRIMEVIKYAFRWERLEGIHIFRLPELGTSRLFVSDEFKRLVEANGLTGLEFYPVPLVEE